MSYAASYALFNYTLEDPSKGLVYSNLRLVRAFERGLDPRSSEAGFILTHVDMVKDTPGLIKGALQVLETLQKDGPRSEVNDGFREILSSMDKIEAGMEGMFPNLFLNQHNLTTHQTCGPTPNHPSTSPSASSSSASPRSPCSLTA